MNPTTTASTFPVVPTTRSRGWLVEVAAGLAVAAISAGFGAIAGIVWAHLARHIPAAQLLNEAERADKQMLGWDLSFAAVTATAGVLVVALLVLAGRFGRRLRTWLSGPGTNLGLAFGGLAGAWLTNVVGSAMRDSDFKSALHRLVPQITHALRTLELNAHQFGLRSLGFLVVWPLIAVLLHALVVSLGREDSDLDPPVLDYAAQ